MRTAFLSLALLVTLVGCGGTDPIPSPVGTYTLQGVNNSGLPALYFANTAGTVTIEAGTLTVRDDGSFTESQDRRAAYFGGGTFVNTVRESGTWTASGGSVTFVLGSGGAYSGSFDRRTLTFTRDGDAYRFAK